MSEGVAGCVSLTVEGSQGQETVLLLVLDRWGRVLLEEGDGGEGEEFWRVPRGSVASLEAPDEAALRLSEEVAGRLLDRLELFRVFRGGVDVAEGEGALHVYFGDPDLGIEELEQGEGERRSYFRPGELEGLRMREAEKEVLARFFESSAYRALFH